MIDQFRKRINQGKKHGGIYDKDCGDPKSHGDVKNISLETKIQDDMSLLMHDKAC